LNKKYTTKTVENCEKIKLKQAEKKTPANSRQFDCLIHAIRQVVAGVCGTDSLFHLATFKIKPCKKKSNV
jgi:hypothetical protein